MELSGLGKQNARSLASGRFGIVPEFGKLGAEPSNLSGDSARREEAVAIIRSLVTKIEIRPTAERGRTEILVHGALAGLINLATRAPGEPVRTVLMVAGEGFEPPTLGL